MKAIAINGSPREDGNTNYLIKSIFQPLEENSIETDIIHIGGKPIRGCLGCLQCKKNQNKKCIIDTDIVNKAIEKVFDSDIVLLASPTYFSDITSEMKGFIDRLGYVAGANGRLLKRKIGVAAIAVRRGGAVHAFDTLMHFIHITGMISIGSTYWNFGIGRDKGEVAFDQEGMNNMQDIGNNIVWLANKIKK